MWPVTIELHEWVTYDELHVKNELHVTHRGKEKKMSDMGLMWLQNELHVTDSCVGQYLYVGHDTLLVDVWDTSHSCVCHDVSYIMCVNESRPTHMNESRPTRMNESRPTRMNESRPTRISYVMCVHELCLKHTNESRPTRTIPNCRPTCIQKIHVTHMNESCRTFEEVMSHESRSHVPYEWVTFTQINESRPHVTYHSQLSLSPHLYELVTSHVLLSHVSHMNESCHT